MKWLLLLLLLVAAPVFAQDSAVEYLSLNNCVTGGTPCSASNTWKLSNVYVHIDVTATTASLAVECQLTPGDTWMAVAAATAVDAFVPVPERCYQLRINPATCTSCAFTATVSGHLPR